MRSALHPFIFPGLPDARQRGAQVYPWIPASAGMTVSKKPGRHARERGHPCIASNQ
ncbi:MAG: hypothetical protein GY862_06595 [Gammaproteobacteria bacterium]|nr:hypothetical protein [Gammaproteobacteria bacterium]